jgi:hypothetical protein
VVLGRRRVAAWHHQVEAFTCRGRYSLGRTPPMLAAGPSVCEARRGVGLGELHACACRNERGRQMLLADGARRRTDARGETDERRRCCWEGESQAASVPARWGSDSSELSPLTQHRRRAPLSARRNRWLRALHLCGGPARRMRAGRCGGLFPPTAKRRRDRPDARSGTDARHFQRETLAAGQMRDAHGRRE